MKREKLPIIARILLGLAFTVFGAMGLFQLVPMPDNLPEPLMTFNKGLAASRYFMPFLKAVETICGLLLLSGYYVPLALVVLAPIVIHINLVHIFLAPSGLPLAIFLGLLLFYLAFFARPYCERIRPLFRK